MNEGILTETEKAHLRVILRWKVDHGRGWWLDTRTPTWKDLPPVLQGLADKGLVKVSNRLVSGPLRLPTGVWGIHITERGEVVARLYELHLPNTYSVNGAAGGRKG